MMAHRDSDRPGTVAAFARSAVATGRLMATGRLASPRTYHLVRLLNPFSIQGSVRYHVLPGCRREDFLRDPELVAAGRRQGVHDWWRLTEPLQAVPARLG
jgi:hypothetical protein